MKATRWFIGMLIVCVLLGTALGIRPATADEELASVQLPWRNEYLRQDINVSGVAAGFEAYSRLPMVAFYDASNELFRQAAYVGMGLGNCGSNNAWECSNILETTGVGEYNDVENTQDDDLGMYTTGYVYYDGTELENSLRYYYEFSLGSGGGSADLKIIDFDKFTGGAIGSQPALAYDVAGNPHVAVVVDTTAGDLLLYAHQVGTGGSCVDYGGTPIWQCDVIAGGPGGEDDPSIAISAEGTPRITYYDPTNSALRYAYPSTSNQNCGPDNQWRCITIEELDNSGKFPSMAIGTAAYIAYYDAANGAVRLAHYVGAGGNCGEDYVDSSLDYRWQCDTIDQVGYYLTQIGLKLGLAEGYPLLAYMDDSDSAQSVLKLAQPVQRLGLTAGNCGPQNPAYTWDCQVVNQGVYNLAGEVDMTINPQGEVYIGYLEADSSAMQSHVWFAWQRFVGLLPVVIR